MELKDLRFYKQLVTLDHKLAAQVESVYSATKETINSISGCYNNYTMHDMGHGLRVASYIEDLACGVDDEFSQNIPNFNAFEIALMILSAILHDIGMFIRPEDRERIQNNDIAYTHSLTFQGVMETVNKDSEEAIKEIVRLTHAQRIREYINYDFSGKTISGMLQLDDKYAFADDIIDICVAHGENYDYLKKLRPQCTKGNYVYNPQYIAVLLRIADYLDLDKQRTPVLWYKMMRIDGFSRDEWEKHFVVHNEKKFKKYVGDKLQIYFEGKSSNAKIHRKYLAYVDELKAELERADELLNHKDTEEKYRFRISTKIDNCVATEGFKYSDLRLNLDYSSITELLMGKNIYGDRKLGLRELIQNSLDACKLMQEIQDKTCEDDAFAPQVTILISAQKGYVKIKDTGIGMTIDVVKKHFLNVGKSYYKSHEFLYGNYKYKPIGQFGIGFLACFLLSDNVTVKTKYYNNSEVYQIQLERSSEYVVTSTEETGSFCGTEIVLDYNDFFEVFSSKDELVSFVQNYFYTNIPIVIRDVDEKKELARAISNAEAIMARIDTNAASEKYEDIDCSNYSTTLDGIIRIRETKQKNSFDTHSLKEGRVFLYQKDGQHFIEIANVESIPCGFYTIIDYAQISAEAYASIAGSRRKAKSKRNAILALSSKIFILMKKGTQIRFEPNSQDDLRVVINDEPVEDVVTRSGLTYYSELVEDVDLYSPSFVDGGRYIKLQSNPIYGKQYIFSENDSPCCMFYNKGILVKDFYGISCWLPVAYKLRAVINYRENGIKLDVSRNNVIEGRWRITSEVELILLNKLKEEESSGERRDMIISMINHQSTSLA